MGKVRMVQPILKNETVPLDSVHHFPLAKDINFVLGAADKSHELLYGPLASRCLAELRADREEGMLDGRGGTGRRAK